MLHTFNRNTVAAFALFAVAGAVTASVALAQEGDVASVSSFSGTPFLYEGRYRKGSSARRRTEEAVYNGQRTRVVRLENGLPLREGDTILTPGDASLEARLSGGDIWLVHPGSRVEALANPPGWRVLSGRITLLSSGVEGTVVLARESRYENLLVGSYVDVGEAGAVAQGNDLREQEFAGFDVIALPLPVTLDAAASLPESTAPISASPRDENPLDEEGGEESSRPHAGAAPPAEGSASNEAPARARKEQGHAFVSFGKALGGSDSLAKKIGSVQGQAVFWLERTARLGFEIDASYLPEVSASLGKEEQTHQRFEVLIGARLASRRQPVGFYIVPQVGILRFNGTLEVGRTSEGVRVLSEQTVGPAAFFALRPGIEGEAGDFQLGAEGFAGARYSADRVSMRLLAAELDGRFFFLGGAEHRGPFARAFARFEDFSTEKSLGSLGRKEVHTRWTVLGLGVGAVF